MYGVDKNVTIRVALSDSALIEEMQRAKVSVILTGVEGSCVAVTESMFLDVPVGLLVDARIGSKCFINPNTGRLLRRSSLASDLENFISSYSQFTPRNWVLENAVCYSQSTSILNGHIREPRLAESGEWTEDIADHHWRPNPLYVSPVDGARLAPDVSAFPDKYGFNVGHGRSDTQTSSTAIALPPGDAQGERPY
jgi:hypothetical protein